MSIKRIGYKLYEGAEDLNTIDTNRPVSNTRVCNPQLTERDNKGIQEYLDKHYPNLKDCPDKDLIKHINEFDFDYLKKTILYDCSWSQDETAYEFDEVISGRNYKINLDLYAEWNEEPEPFYEMWREWDTDRFETYPDRITTFKEFYIEITDTQFDFWWDFIDVPMTLSDYYDDIVDFFEDYERD